MASRRLRSSIPIVIAALVLTVLAVPSRAATGPYLVKDIVQGGSSWPHELTDLNGTLIFASNGQGKGRELWRSDGTAAGTWLVKNIAKGSSGSDPRDLRAIGGLVYFAATDGVHGFELWVSDGTWAGTRMVKDINPGPVSSSPQWFTEFRDAVYFLTYQRGAYELWRTDLTEAGTQRVERFDRDLRTSYHTDLVRLGGKLFFILSDENAPIGRSVLWRSDGTAAGTRPFRNKQGNKVVGIIPEGWSIGQDPLWSLASVGSRLYFGRYADSHYELWRSNGAADTTVKIADLEIYRAIGMAGTAYFVGGDATGGVLWRSDGTASSTSRVKTVSTNDMPMPGGTILASAGGRLFFDAVEQDPDGYGRPRLWVSDGTSDGTRALDASIRTEGSTVVGSKVYFVGMPVGDVPPDSCQYPCGNLWQSDGTDDGTFSLGPPRAAMYYLTSVGDSIYFVSNAKHNGYELWRYVP